MTKNNPILYLKTKLNKPKPEPLSPQNDNIRFMLGQIIRFALVFFQKTNKIRCLLMLLGDSREKGSNKAV